MNARSVELSLGRSLRQIPVRRLRWTQTRRPVQTFASNPDQRLGRRFAVDERCQVKINGCGERVDLNNGRQTDRVVSANCRNVHGVNAPHKLEYVARLGRLFLHRRVPFGVEPWAIAVAPGLPFTLSLCGRSQAASRV